MREKKKERDDDDGRSEQIKWSSKIEWFESQLQQRTTTTRENTK